MSPLEEDEIWTTRDGRRLKVGEMEEAHVRDALRLVIRRHRKRMARQARTRAIIEAAERDLDYCITEDMKWGDS